MASMKAYLAEKYMSGPKADAILERVAPKKRKRKAVITQSSQAGTSASFLKDDDAGWGDEGKEDIEDLTDAVIEKDRGFKKRKQAVGGGKSEGPGSAGWTTIRDGEASATKADTPPPEDEKPMVVDATPFTGGLVTAQQLSKAKPKVAPAKLTEDEIAAAQETVYRDASGRKIDVKAERAEAAKKKREREEKEAEKMEWGKGLVQREEKERQKRQMERDRHKGFSRGKDDEDLNEDLKSKELWNDPAAAFMTKKRSKGPKKPEYNGPPPPPNRFGIKPGYRWDGVDRGNGFEKKLFQTRNSRKRLDLESYQWGAEDM